jgi:peptide-methionine (S)-S-oxide reductase
VISYEELLDIFWQSHNPRRAAWSRQYAAFILTHDAAQAKIAHASRDALGDGIATDIRTAGAFWRAEDYHQKYRLRHQGELCSALIAHFGGDREFVDSTAAARLNGLLSGYGSKAGLESLNLPPEIVTLVP